MMANIKLFNFVRQTSCLVSKLNTLTVVPTRNVSAGTDEPIEIENPYKPEKQQCILCKYKIEPNYKNPRLLSQFVSPYTGVPYEKHITGLCERQHRLVQQAIKRCWAMGLMSKHFRNPIYYKDPKLFDPFRPTRPNPY